jgi:hypothetical protein
LGGGREIHHPHLPLLELLTRRLDLFSGGGLLQNGGRAAPQDHSGKEEGGVDGQRIVMPATAVPV